MDIYLNRYQRIAVTLGILLILGLLIYLLRGVLLPIFIALFLAYLLDPVIDRMEARRINRSLGIVILAAVAFVVIGSLAAFFLVQTQREIADLIQKMPAYLDAAHDRLNPLALQYLGRDIPWTFDDLFAEARKYLNQIDPSALKPVSAIVARISSSTWALLSWAFGLVIIPVFLFYFLRDWDRMKLQVTAYIPLDYRDYIREKIRAIDDVLSAFFRGQITVAAILGVIYSLGLLALGVDLAVIIGLASGIAFIVPYMGTALGIVAASIMVFLEFGFSWRIPGAWAVFALGQSLEAFVLTPRITGEKVGLSPIAVIFALMVGAELLGFLGILIAVPVAAVVNVIFKDLLERYRNSSYFLERTADNQTQPPKKDNPQ